MAAYAELNALPAEAFLNADNFLTAFDGNRKHASYTSDNYFRGLEQGNESTEVGICANGTWYAKGKDGSSTTSYEGIGYHAGTADFWAGVLDSGCRVCVYRDSGKVCIKEAVVRGYNLYDENGLWGRGSDLDDLVGRARRAGLVDFALFRTTNDKVDFAEAIYYCEHAERLIGKLAGKLFREAG